MVAVRTLLERHRSLAWGQAVSPPLQRDRIQLRARRVAQLQTWPYLCRKAARLQRRGARMAPIRPLMDRIEAVRPLYLTWTALVLVPLVSPLLEVANLL